MYLKLFYLKSKLLVLFHSAVIESVLCTSITVWFGSGSYQIRQQTVRTAERIIGTPLPTLKDLYSSRERKRAAKIITDSSHPGHNLFELSQDYDSYHWPQEHLGTGTVSSGHFPSEQF